jgi:phospholipase C
MGAHPHQALPPYRPSRRRILQGAGLTGLTIAGSRWLEVPARAAAATSALPSPAQSGIEHIVVLMMENRSFDHFLGWLPGANGRQAGLRYRDLNGTWQKPIT